MASCSLARAAKAGRSGGLPVIELMPSRHSTRGPLRGPRSSRRACSTSPGRKRRTGAPRASASPAAGVPDLPGADAREGAARGRGEGGGLVGGRGAPRDDRPPPPPARGGGDVVGGGGEGGEGEAGGSAQLGAPGAPYPPVGLGAG